MASSDDCMAWSPLISVALSVVLSGASGFRATVPLFLTSLLHQAYGLELWEQLEWLGSPVATVGLGVLLLVEVIADMIPCVDNCLHTVMTAIHPIVGAVAAVLPMACTGWGGAMSLAAVGSVIALLTHVAKAGLRLASTGGSGGCCNPVISIIETVLTAMVVVLAVVFAVATFVAAVITLCIMAYGIRTAVRRWRERKAGKSESADPLTPKPQDSNIVIAVPVPEP